MRDAFMLQSEFPAGLASRRNGELGPAVKGGHFHLKAQSRLGKVDGKFINNVILLPDEEFMLGYG